MLRYEHYFRAKGILVGIAFIIIGSFIMFSVSREWVNGMRSRSWDPVEAVIVASQQKEVTVHGSGGEAYVVPALDFRYRYQVGDRTFESGMLLAFANNDIDVRDIPEFIRTHAQGDRLTVYFDRKHPERAVVERGVPAAGILFILLPGLMVAIGPFIVWGSANGAIVRYCERHGLSLRGVRIR